MPLRKGITELPGPIEHPINPDTGRPYTVEEYYDLTQKQRGFERAIRKTKAEIADARIAGIDDTAARLKLGRQQKRIREFTKEHGLPRHRYREKAYGIDEQPRALLSEKYIQIGRSVGAKAWRDQVLIAPGVYGQLAEGSRVTKIVLIAGDGHPRKIDEVDGLVERFGGKRAKWQKFRGTGDIEDMGLIRRGELHWYQESSVGRVKMKVVRFYS